MNPTKTTLLTDWPDSFLYLLSLYCSERDAGRENTTPLGGGDLRDS